MKTAISIPDPVFRKVERAARRLGISRSELFTRAVKEFLTAERDAAVTASYDRAFGPDTGPDDTRDFRRVAATRVLRKVEW